MTFPETSSDNRSPEEKTAWAQDYMSSFSLSTDPAEVQKFFEAFHILFSNLTDDQKQLLGLQAKNLNEKIIESLKNQNDSLAQALSKATIKFSNK